MTIRSDMTENRCPITFALDIFGDKWSLLIVRDMLFKQKQYYGEFLNSAEKISTNILANRLSKLEAEQIISKSRDPHNGAKYLYQLTEKGKALVPLMLEMIVWSSTYDPQPDAPDCIITGAPDDLLRKSRDERPMLIAEILQPLD